MILVIVMIITRLLMEVAYFIGKELFGDFFISLYKKAASLFRGIGK